MVGVLEQTEMGRKLVMRSYSPSIHIGTKTHIGGTLWDPDLTYVGDFVTIGAKTEIGAHLWIPTPSGKLKYVTAPVRIGAYAFIGGGVSISLGCIIGEHAMIEPFSYLPPHTSVPSGEVWGGNPASFKRKRSPTVSKVNR
jgi:acetyltransferase-like isoleucine patch superfamily enzyme